jgi:hypothetical protein
MATHQSNLQPVSLEGGGEVDEDSGGRDEQQPLPQSDSMEPLAKKLKPSESSPHLPANYNQQFVQSLQAPQPQPQPQAHTQLQPQPQPQPQPQAPQQLSRFQIPAQQQVRQPVITEPTPALPADRSRNLENDNVADADADDADDALGQLLRSSEASELSTKYACDPLASIDRELYKRLTEATRLEIRSGMVTFDYDPSFMKQRFLGLDRHHKKARWFGYLRWPRGNKTLSLQAHIVYQLCDVSQIQWPQEIVPSELCDKELVSRSTLLAIVAFGTWTTAACPQTPENFQRLCLTLETYKKTASVLFGDYRIELEVKEKVLFGYLAKVVNTV